MIGHTVVTCLDVLWLKDLFSDYVMCFSSLWIELCTVHEFVVSTVNSIFLCATVLTCGKVCLSFVCNATRRSAQRAELVSD